MRQVRSRDAQPVGIALRADCQHHRLCRDRAAVFQADREVSGFALDRGHFSVQTRVDLLFGKLAVPHAKDRLALARIESEIATQDQIGRSEEHTSELQSLMRISYAVF